MTDPRQAAESVVAEVVDAVGDRLEGALLYGSVPRGEAVEGVSDVNVLLVLDTAGPAELGDIAPLVKRWSGAGNTAPLVVSDEEWRDGADAFVIELSDMLDAGVLLHGRDPRAGLGVNRPALRLQAERELRGKLIQLRTGLMLAADSPGDAGRLLLTALPSFTTYLRAALRLGTGTAPSATGAVIEQGCRLIGADPDAFGQCWDARTQKRWVRPHLHDPLVQGYYDTAEKAVAYVDAFTEDGR